MLPYWRLLCIHRSETTIFWTILFVDVPHEQINVWETQTRCLWKWLSDQQNWLLSPSTGTSSKLVAFPRPYKTRLCKQHKTSLKWWAVLLLNGQTTMVLAHRMVQGLPQGLSCCLIIFTLSASTPPFFSCVLSLAPLPLPLSKWTGVKAVTPEHRVRLGGAQRPLSLVETLQLCHTLRTYSQKSVFDEHVLSAQHLWWNTFRFRQKWENIWFPKSS